MWNVLMSPILMSISKFYNDIVKVLCEGGEVVSNNTHCRNGTTNTARNNCRPGWNDHIDELHQIEMVSITHVVLIGSTVY